MALSTYVDVGELLYYQGSACTQLQIFYIYPHCFSPDNKLHVGRLNKNTVTAMAREEKQVPPQTGPTPPR